MRNLRKRFTIIPISILALTFMISFAATRELLVAFASDISENDPIAFDESNKEFDFAAYLTNQLAESGELYNETSSLSAPMSSTVNGITEIDYSSIIRNIRFFGQNTDIENPGSCGMVAMGILLQF